MTDSIPQIRPARKEDNAEVARIIRDVMTEFGAVGRNYSISDPEVSAMYEAYPAPEAAFFVIEQDGRILGCGGMGRCAVRSRLGRSVPEDQTRVAGFGLGLCAGHRDCEAVSGGRHRAC